MTSSHTLSLLATDDAEFFDVCDSDVFCPCLIIGDTEFVDFVILVFDDIECTFGGVLSLVFTWVPGDSYRS